MSTSKDIKPSSGKARRHNRKTGNGGFGPAGRRGTIRQGKFPGDGSPGLPQVHVAQGTIFGAG